MSETYELATVIPAYNECKSLPGLIERYRSAAKGTKFQLVIVDNGASDGTAEYLSELKKDKKNAFIKVVTVVKNIGYGNGIYQGLLQAEAPAIGWSHGDLQCAPEDVFKGYQKYTSLGGKRLVKGHRYGRNWKPLVLTYGLAFISTVILLKWFDDINGQPKIFPRELLQHMHNPPKGFSFDMYVQNQAIAHGYRVSSFPVKFEQRVYGVSKWATTTFSKMGTIRSFFMDVLKLRVGVLR
jgi:glycosyltransferase involved in cell wall biosynthesis